ncbi:hypothetical protein AB0E10_39385 [Streptomyces sp. NPDC048045]|uniref:hypothetical protein n=1 Tax=Streptomyces sp. NPDC048045 TaxID=3154710 RepID=UPI003414D69C
MGPAPESTRPPDNVGARPAQDAVQHRSRGAPLGVSHRLGDEVPALTAGLLNPKAPLAEEDVTIHSTCATVVMSRPTPRYRVPSRRADW